MLRRCSGRTRPSITTSAPTSTSRAWPSTFTLGKTVPNLPVRIDDVSGAHNSHGLLAVEILLLPDAVGFQHGVGGVARQGKIQLVLVAKLLQLFHRVTAYTQNPCSQLVQFFFGVTELVRLARSTRGVGFGEKEKNQVLPLKVFEVRSYRPSRTARRKPEPCRQP